MVYSSGYGRSIQNVNKGWNTEYDTTSEVGIFPAVGLNHNWAFLEFLYRQSWQCRRVVDFYPNKMIKGWGNLESDNKRLVQDTRTDFNKIRKIYNQGQKAGNLYGDAYAIRFVDDGRDVDEPINFDDVREIKYSRVLSPQEVEPFVNYQEIDFYDPEYYDVSVGGFSLQRYHRDRVLRFSGLYLTPEEFERNNYCHASVLEPFYQPFVRHEQSVAHVAEAMTSFEFLLFGVQGLFEDIEGGDITTVQQLKDKYKIVQQQMSSNRGVVHDLDEQTVTLGERKFTNIDKIIEDVFRKELIAASGLTKTQLYNEHPSGMNSTGESDLRSEADRVIEYQELKWRELIDFDTRLNMSKNKVSEGYKWVWNSIYQTTKKEEVDMDKTIAETKKIYFEMGQEPENNIEQEMVLDAKYSDKEKDDIYTKYRDTVNMSASELRAWSETKHSKKASLDRSPINRNIELLETKKSDWTNKHYGWANKTISFVSRMKNGEQGEPVDKETPYSKRDISLKNWAFDPGKRGDAVDRFIPQGNLVIDSDYAPVNSEQLENLGDL